MGADALRVLSACVVGAGLLAGCGGGTPARPATASTSAAPGTRGRLARVGPGERCPVSPVSTLAEKRLGRSLGSGPLYPILPSGARLGLRPVRGTIMEERLRPGTYLAKVIWAAPPNFRGPATVRGVSRSGRGRMSFVLDAEPTEAMVLDAANAGRAEDGWRLWNSYTVVSGPGCYTYRVTGPGIVQDLTFEAILASSRLR
jgi:hypothetical protein